MTTRIGAFKTGGCQLTVWQRPEQITFEFAKAYRDKKTGQWKQAKTIYVNELKAIGDMFLRAAEWAARRDCGNPLPSNMELAKDEAEKILGRIKERYETNSTVER